MCGIAGFLQMNLRTDLWKTILCNMTDAIVYRGPDDSGIWFDAEAGVGLGHRRLAILDLSPLGHQPMISPTGRFTMVYNGEVYNYKEMLVDLQKQGYYFRGHSDTEILLAAFEAWGIETTIKRSVGMFALALWDAHEQILYLIRDRLGEKPLYYGWVANAFVFGSELKTLKAHPLFQNPINRDALALLMRHNYIPTPYSIYQNINKLPPGSILKISNLANQKEPTITKYWDVKEICENGNQASFTGSTSEAIDQLDTLLRKAVQLQMVADVPLGAFLSGGIDSSTIVALMQSQSSRPIKTFSIGFTETAYNEANYAKAVANYLGTEHTELYVTPTEALSVIPKLPTIYSEPFADSSQIPTFLVANLARQHVTVSLSGDGGDELFGGYKRYAFGNDMWSKIGKIPRIIRQIAGKTLTTVPTSTLDKGFFWLSPVFSRYGRKGSAGKKLHLLGEVLDAPNESALYLHTISHWKNPTSLVLDSQEPLTALTDMAQQSTSLDFYQRMMYLDTISYLLDDILVKVDRASMGVSLEARVPLLDHHVVEFAWQLPLALKVNQGQSKWILRQILYRYIPENLFERPKMGFGIPLGQWLRSSNLRDWAENLLDERRLANEGFFQPHLIRQKWGEHLQGNQDWSSYLWDVLMFQAWLEHNS